MNINENQLNQQRRKFIKNSAYVAGYGILFSQLIACKTGAKIPTSIKVPEGSPYQMDFIRGGVGFFTERGGTIGWYMSEKGNAVVDTQFPEQSGHLLDEFNKVKGAKVDVLINTHHHGDHTAGNIKFKDLTTQVIAHENSRVNQIKSAKKNDNEKDQLYPNLVFKKSYAINSGDETIQMKYFGAAHTNGDALVHFTKANVVHMGDLVFNRRFPYIDKSAGANIQNWVKVLDKVDTNYDDDTIFMWGHANEGFDVKGDKEDIKAFKNYLEKLLEFGMQSIKSGVALEDLKANTTSIPGAAEWTGKGIERSLDAVYAELAAE